MATLIRQLDGIVIAEQLAALAVNPPALPHAVRTLSDDAVVDEGYVLPMAVRFGGSPTVTEEGNIVYQFEVHRHRHYLAPLSLSLSYRLTISLRYRT